MDSEILRGYFYNKAYTSRTPVSVIIELLTKCNLKCKHCYLPEHQDAGLSFERVKTLLRQLREIGVVNVSLTGGEILLRKDLFDIIEIARDLHMRVILLSNGTLLDREKVERLANAYIAQFSTTLFSLNEETHDFITGEHGSLKKLLNGLQLLKEKGIRVMVKTPLMSVNKNDFRDVKKYCEENGFEFSASSLIFSKLDGDESPLNLRIPQNELISILQELDAINEKGHIHEYDNTCSALRFSFAIDCQGDIFPCNSFQYKLGNIDEVSLDKLWNDSQELIHIQNLKMSEIEKCKSCSYKNYCHRCPGMAFSDCGNLSGCDSYAKILAETRKAIASH